MARVKRRKKMQRKINHYVKMMNKNIQEDSLWQGRFYCRQVRGYYHEYEDHSGGRFVVILKFIDKVTGIEKEYALEYLGHEMFFASDLWWKMNDFIVEDCEVWKNRNN